MRHSVMLMRVNDKIDILMLNDDGNIDPIHFTTKRNTNDRHMLYVNLYHANLKDLAHLTIFAEFYIHITKHTITRHIHYILTLS